MRRRSGTVSNSVPVLNADTGYLFEMNERLYAEVLQRFREAFPDSRSSPASRFEGPKVTRRSRPNAICR
jgi:hypothetical protein